MTEPTPLAPYLVRHGRDALAAWRAVVGRVGDADLALPTPCTEFTVADLGEHVHRSMLLLAESAGTRLAAASDSTPLRQSVPLAEAALDVWERRGVGGTVPVGSRTVGAERAYAIVLMELAVHGWDLARAVSAPTPDLDEEFVEYLLAQANLLITPDRRGRAFAEAVSVGADARSVDQLVAFTGRAP